MATKAKTVTEIKIPALNIITMGVRIKGLTPLIYHKFSEKSKKQMRDKQAKKASTGREVRNPEQEYYDSFYYDLDGNIAFPALSVKQSVIGSARQIDGVTMVEVMGAVIIVGDVNGMIPVLVNNKKIKPGKLDLDGPFPDNIFGIDKSNPNIEMREDTVTVGMGSTDLRYRGSVKNWEMAFIVKFNGNKFSPEQVLNLFQYAGFACGLGEWRTEKSGLSGAFEISSTSEEAVK